jgi:putative GTP pyrophosphokinase
VGDRCAGCVRNRIEKYESVNSAQVSRRETLDDAVREYGRLEAEAAKGAQIELVLVSAGPVDKLRRAYPNFFLDIRDFLISVTEIIDSVKS